MFIDVITIFPKMFSPVIDESIIKRAQEKGLVKINIHNLRDYSKDAHKSVDGSPYGGGGGMVFHPEPFFLAVEAITKSAYLDIKKDKKTRIVLFSPRGKTLTQGIAKKFLQYERVILLSPRYEGVDERVSENLIDEEISIGDYVLSGGELPAMVFIDSIVRLIPGVVSQKDSIINESFENNLIDFPHYTRPENFRDLKVPQVLLSGNHKKIKEWRKKKARELTKKYRPDLLKK